MELITKEVEFNENKITGILKDGKIYTPLRRFCEVLGVDFEGQRQRIRRDEILSLGLTTCKIKAVENGVEKSREILILEIEFLPLWLTGIKANQCREEVRANLLEFKLKAKDVLADAFLGKRAIPSKDWGLNTIKQNVIRVEEIENQIEDLISQLNPLYEEIRRVSVWKRDSFTGMYQLFRDEESKNPMLGRDEVSEK